MLYRLLTYQESCYSQKIWKAECIRQRGRPKSSHVQHPGKLLLICLVSLPETDMPSVATALFAGNEL